MLITPNDNSLNSVLEELAKSLDITQAQHDSAVESYEFVAKHLASETSPLAKYSPEILPQGSFC
jgi:primosomal protein N''